MPFSPAVHGHLPPSTPLLCLTRGVPLLRLQAGDGDAKDGSDTRSLTGAAEEEAASGGGEGLASPSATLASVRQASFLQCFCRLDTMLLLGFMAVMNLKSSLFITTFAEEASLLFEGETADALATTFNLAFPIGGFLTSVLASLMLEVRSPLLALPAHALARPRSFPA